MYASAILFLALACGSGYGHYLLEPSVSWPEEYHFNAEDINLVSGVTKPFEIWYSEKHNRSRIDLYGGTVKRYYYAKVDEDGDQQSVVYEFHPETDQDEDSEDKCTESEGYGDQEDFLPGLYNFEYAGTQELRGLQVQVWKNTEMTSSGSVALRNEEYLYVSEENDVGIPVQHIKKTFNMENGGLSAHSIINYYNFDSDIKEEELTADTDDCNAWGYPNLSLEDSLKRLHPIIPGDLDLAFQKYKEHHKRDYEDEEHKLRKEIFKRNWHFIADHNSKKLGYTLAINKFADRTPDELKYLAATKNSPIREGTHPFPHTKEELEAIAPTLPEDYDLRMEGVVSPIRNQANCGSCWAFATTATVETAVARKNGGRVIDLSEQSLVDCAWEFNSHGCGGTEAIDAPYRYVLKHGIPSVREYGPYLEEDGVCRINNMTDVYRIKGYVGVTPNSRNALKTAIYNYGAVTIGILASSNLIFYNSGVFYDFSCEPNAMNHAVTVIGYGTRDGDLYWIVKNSWGEDWGEDGYVLMAAADNNCNVMTVPFYPIV